MGGVGVPSKHPLFKHEIVELVHLLGGPKKSKLLNFQIRKKSKNLQVSDPLLFLFLPVLAFRLDYLGLGVKVVGLCFEHYILLDSFI